MGILRELGRRLRTFLGGAQAERELDEEMRLHVELREERLRSQGLSPADARAAARQRFGSLLRHREEGMDAWGWRWLEQLGQDVRYGARTLLKSPGFAATAIVTLGLATGATTAIFSTVNSVLLRPLPFDDPERLVRIYGRAWSHDRDGQVDPLTGPVAATELAEFKRGTSFEDFAGYEVTTRHLEAPSGLERHTALVADLELFTLLGVEPLVGRTFNTSDSPDVVVISTRLWEHRFNRDPSLVGRSITLDGRAFTVVGVMPESFQFPYRAASLMAGALPESRTDIWVPLDPLRRGRLAIIGRLKPGVGLDAATAELRAIATRVEEQVGTTNRRIGVRLSPLADVVLGPVRQSLWMLFAAVSLVLAAACANVANLLLARMTVRTREVATRAALGAGRLRLVRQFLAESLLLSLAGGLIGAAITYWGTNLLVALCTGRIPRAHEITLDWQAFAFLLLACLTTAVLFGLAPAFMAARIDVQGVTKEAGGHATVGRSYTYLRDSLAVLEIALAFLLAVGAALVIREIVRLRHVDAGMVTENAIALHLTPRAPAADYYAIEARVAALPSVRGAGFIQLVPLQNWGWEAMFSIRGRPADPTERLVAALRYVTPGYFRALGIPIRAGRGLSESDTAEAPKVILVNEAFARRYFPGEDPVDRETDRGTIVGVVGDVRNVHLDRPAEPELYYPAAQNVTMASDIGMSLLVRSDGPAERLIQPVRSVVHETNPNLAIFNIKTMDEVLSDSLWELNLYRWLIGLFATLALVLAAIGLYGVISYTAAARSREFAIRLALGSSHSALGRLVLGRGFWLAGGGLASGVAGLLALTWWFDDLPAGIRPDATTSIAVAAVLVAITLIACAVPAIRAAAVNPVSALRQE